MDRQIADDLGVSVSSVRATTRLLAEGATVPFIARYRKEATGALDEVQIRTIGERRSALIELHERRRTILEEIEKQGKLSDALARRIMACSTRTALEDLYLPYRPRRRTRAQIARERGLQALADRIVTQPDQGAPLTEAQSFVNPAREVPDVEAALEGARDIVAEALAENADARALVREAFDKHAMLTSSRAKKDQTERSKFEQYYEHAEPVSRIPSHRYLAIRRGEREGILRVRFELDPERLYPRLCGVMGMRRRSPFASLLQQAVGDGYKRLLAPSVESDLRVQLKMRSDRAAVDIFAENLRQLLMAAPLGGRSVIGIDPGIRTGCKCVTVSETGRFGEDCVLHLSKGRESEQAARSQLRRWLEELAPAAIAVGNGTGGREAERFARSVVKECEKSTLVVSVNEAGASVYSASDTARDEFPDLDLTVRGSISIARRLQDPLAELVKIDPKAIGVGQYQHDVHQPMLARKLDEVVESCVNAVGVELNTASAALLCRVAGIGEGLARKIVQHRDTKGPFHARSKLLEVPGLGPRTYEQAAGFLRVGASAHPLDASAVHPERYALVERLARDLGAEVGQLVGNRSLLDRVDVTRYVDNDLGEHTLRDIVDELDKPGRDPRANFQAPSFRDDLEQISDLREGMTLEGVVTNVTAFGAFVDVGVHQDGLVHISQLADRFVRDPSEVVSVGDRLKVRVLEVDLQRKRISLSARQDAGKGEQRGSRTTGHRSTPGNAHESEARDRKGEQPAGARQQRSGTKQQRSGEHAQARSRARGTQETTERFDHNPFARALKKKS